MEAAAAACFLYIFISVFMPCCVLRLRVVLCVRVCICRVTVLDVICGYSYCAIHFFFFVNVSFLLLIC